MSAVRRRLGSLKRRITQRPPPGSAAEPSSDEMFDSWLEHYHGEALGEVDERLADSPANGYRLFRPFDDDLWTILLFRQYSSYPNIRRFLPELPDPALQRTWNSAHGMLLAPRSKAFYGKLKKAIRTHGSTPLREASVLDFGCGWGRMTRFLGRDVAPGNLFGCDPSTQILALCEELGVPGRLERSEATPRRLPFDQRFDLVFAHSVFTHLSEATHQACLRAIHDSLEPGGILVLTVRPPAFIKKPQMTAVREQLDGPVELDAPRYYFAPHRTAAPGADVSFGNVLITVPYMRERWTPLFEIADISYMVDSMEQVVVTLRRRDDGGSTAPGHLSA